MLQMAACIRLLILAHLASSSYEFSSTNASTSTSSSQSTSIETLKKILLLSSACHLRKTESLFPTTSTIYEPLSIYTSSPFELLLLNSLAGRASTSTNTANSNQLSSSITSIINELSSTVEPAAGVGVDRFSSTNVSFSREHLSNEYSSFGMSTASEHSPIEISPTSELYRPTTDELPIARFTTNKSTTCELSSTLTSISSQLSSDAILNTVFIMPTVFIAHNVRFAGCHIYSMCIRSERVFSCIVDFKFLICGRYLIIFSFLILILILLIILCLYFSLYLSQYFIAIRHLLFISVPVHHRHPRSHISPLFYSFSFFLCFFFFLHLFLSSIALPNNFTKLAFDQQSFSFLSPHFQPIYFLLFPNLLTLFLLPISFTFLISTVHHPPFSSPASINLPPSSFSYFF